MSNFLRPNLFKQKLKHRVPQAGFWINIPGGDSAELASDAGFDWLLIDMEHTVHDLSDVVHQLRAVGRSDAEAMVRVPSIDPPLVKRLLDLGARSLMFPNVKTVEEATLAVASTRYAPHGMRGVAGTTRGAGWGRSPEYFKNYTEDTVVVLQLESIEGISNAEAIGNVDGVDALFVGPSDLAADAGFINTSVQPEVLEQVQLALAAITKTPAAAGILCFDEKLAKEYFSQGFSFIAVGGDLPALAKHTVDLALRYSSLAGNRHRATVLG